MSKPLALLVEDHPLFRVGFMAAWQQGLGRPSLFEASDVASARALLRERTFRLAIIDVLLPDGCGLQLVAPLASAGTAVVILTTYVRRGVVAAARQLGAVGVLSKEADPSAILVNIDRVLQYPDATVFPDGPPLAAFTRREREVLHKLMQGRSNRAIAAELGIGSETVKTYVGALMDRMGVRNRVEVAKCAVDLGLDVALPYLGDDGE